MATEVRCIQVVKTGALSRRDTSTLGELDASANLSTDPSELGLTMMAKTSYEVGQQTASQRLKTAKMQYEDGQRPDPGLEEDLHTW